MFQLLSLNPDIQTRLREELEQANSDSGLEYSQLMNLPLLDAVVKETLRMLVCFICYRPLIDKGSSSAPVTTITRKYVSVSVVKSNDALTSLFIIGVW